MALLPIVGLETHPLGTVGVNGILNNNWERLEEVFEDLDDNVVIDWNSTTKKFSVRPLFGTQTYFSTTNLTPAVGLTQRVNLTGNVTFITSSLVAGRNFNIIIAADGSTRNLTWPAGWTWIGGTAPATIAANKTGLLEIMATTGADSGVIARWTVQP